MKETNELQDFLWQQKFDRLEKELDWKRKIGENLATAYEDWMHMIEMRLERLEQCLKSK